MEKALEASPIRVLVVAEDVLARGGLVSALRDWPDLNVVGRASPGDEYQELLMGFRPDVVLWDVGWLEDSRPPDEWGASEQPPVLVLIQEPDQAALAWSWGARGVLMRSTDGATLAAAVRSLALGLSVAAESLWPDPNPASARPGTGLELEELTPRELEVLQLLAEGLSNRGIAHRLGVSEHTVKFHVNSILGKLNAQSRTEAAVVAARAGLLHF